MKPKHYNYSGRVLNSAAQMHVREEVKEPVD